MKERDYHDLTAIPIGGGRMEAYGYLYVYPKMLNDGTLIGWEVRDKIGRTVNYTIENLPDVFKNAIAMLQVVEHVPGVGSKDHFCYTVVVKLRSRYARV